MIQYGTWVSYSGSARIVLAVVLLAVAGGLAYAGIRLRRPVRPARPGRAAVTFMLLAWVLAIATFLVCVAVYVLQYRHEFPGTHGAPTNHITPVTFLAAALTFFIVLIASQDGAWTRLTSAAIAAMAAPMLFELPFDLIVMARTYPPIPPHPALFRALFFLPLFLIEITTLSLLTMSPMTKLNRGALLSLASMFAVFAIWGLLGFGYPSGPAPTVLNLASKILAFVATLWMLLPPRPRASPPEPRVSAGSTPETTAGPAA